MPLARQGWLKVCMLNVRKASKSDIELYFSWANDAVVRMQAFQNKKITFKNHESWFVKKLSDTNSCLYVIENHNVPIGQVRFDLNEKEAIIDYSIDSKFRGQGFGKEILLVALQKFVTEFQKVKFVKGIVKVANVASQKIFIKLGFIEEKTKCKDSESFIYLLSLCEINKRRMIKEITDKL
jgi:RimJ/RimL family protein N-acetyltransferase